LIVHRSDRSGVAALQLVEIVGAAHASQNELDFGPNYLDILAAGAPMPPLTAGFGPRSPFHIGIFQSAALANLDLWVRYGVPPPPGALINFQNGTPVLDQFGNVAGGVRSPWKCCKFGGLT
jgi:Alpha/beta hydrolase domain